MCALKSLIARKGNEAFKNADWDLAIKECDLCDSAFGSRGLFKVCHRIPKFQSVVGTNYHQLPSFLAGVQQGVVTGSAWPPLGHVGPIGPVGCSLGAGHWSDRLL